MEWIGKRVKYRSKERLYKVEKLKKMETMASEPPPQKRRRRKASDIEDVTPTYYNIRPSQVSEGKSSSSRIRSRSEENVSVKESLFKDLKDEKSGPSSTKLGDVSEHNTSVKESFIKVRDLHAVKSVPSSSGLRKVSEQNIGVNKSFVKVIDLDVSEPKTCVKDKCSPEIKGLDTEKSVPGEIEILSGSESDTEARALAKKKLLEDSRRIVKSSSDGEDDTSESEDEKAHYTDDINAKDDIEVESSSSEDPSSASLLSLSSSSSDEEFNLNEADGDTDDDDDDDDVSMASSPIRKVSIAEREPLGRYKSGSCLTRPTKDDKKIRKVNCGEVERVTKQSGTPMFTCAHCGKENTGISESRSSGIRPQALGDEIKEANNVASTNVSMFEESVPINARRTPEKSSRPEVANEPTGDGNNVASTNVSKFEEFVPINAGRTPEKSSRPEVANKPIDVEFDSSVSSADKSAYESEPGYESEPSSKDKEVKTNDNSEWRMLNGNNKKVDFLRLLVNSVWKKDKLGEGEEEEDILVSSPEEGSQEQGKEDQRKYDDDGRLIIRPAPLNLRFGVEEPQPPPEKSESEIEEERLWEELAFYSKPNDASDEHPSIIEKEPPTYETPAAQCKNGIHELCIDLEIGLKCIHCGFVGTEIRHMDEAEWGEKIIRERRQSARFEEENSSFFGKLGFEVPNQNSSNEGCSSSEGSVWDKIPGVKSQMYPHQQEGFEFIWRNLAGTIKLDELKNFKDSDETGGCIMSHAPGTGKTRLTIIFLQAYLECFPDCKPVIIAPASLLLTWAEEFKKWNINIPFHNLSSLEFTGKENSKVLELVMQKNPSARSNNEVRMAKIFSWMKAKSILGISYNLYEKLTGDKKTKSVRKVKPQRELEDIREMLIRLPGLLVLDEAHTPRNQRSCIWKTLSKVETQKRILLSGTPFQNNFQELCNVLGLARPKYLEKLTSTIKKSGMTIRNRGTKTLENEINNRWIEELKTVMFPFVHVHKGSILQKSLPGLRECVVVLNPPELQKRVLESIEVTHNHRKINVFDTEHKLSLVSIHPSLVSSCKLSEKESLSIDEALLAQLKKVRLDPNQSVKTKFLMEFIRLCDVIKEKVLVFSQYIDPLELIMEHLISRFKWNSEEEVLYMHGKLEQKQRQTLINKFNDPKSKAKVFLASTRACSEGISLVGASRVILLDVVWNPAVERQAISRAYRIGQQRIVYTYHLVAKGTPEGPKYCKQAQKDRISELVFACSLRHDKGKGKIGEAVTEDRVLDNMVQTLGDVVDKLIVQPKEADLVEGFNVLMP